ncbi:MAG TPA: tetratricopeptide repeat protein [Anaeromyxobacter sp.]|nr:tetratricopeptide repeat protein [Anaeromyxobacter sp.]
MTLSARDALPALLLLVGCAGGSDATKKDLDAMRAELQAVRKDNEELQRKVDALSGRVEVITARLSQAPQPAQPPAAAAPVVPPDLAVVRVEPPRAARTPPPPVPTAVPIAEPDPGRVAALSRRSGHEIAQDADEELRRARGKAGASRAHALEDFAARYPRHASADNALVEAAAAYADAGKPQAACDLARRCVSEYPAGDAMSDALERLAWCESRRGDAGAERTLLERLVSDFPRTPAAERAAQRLATISGQGGEPPPGPARSGP